MPIKCCGSSGRPFSGVALTAGAHAGITTAEHTITWEGIVYDTDSYFSFTPDPTSITLPFAGHYLICAMGAFQWQSGPARTETVGVRVDGPINVGTYNDGLANFAGLGSSAKRCVAFMDTFAASNQLQLILYNDDAGANGLFLSGSIEITYLG